MSRSRWALLLACVLAFCAAGDVRAQGRAVSKSPCPDVFQYQHDGQRWYGAISVPAPKYGTQAKLLITMSLAARLPTKYSGSIDLDGGENDLLNKIIRGTPISYIIHFPLLWPVPKVTGIFFNGRTICSGPPEFFTNGVTTITNISLEHTLNTGDDIQGGSYYPLETSYNGYKPNQYPAQPSYPTKPTYEPIPSFSGGDEDAINSFINTFLNNNGQREQDSAKPAPAPPIIQPSPPVQPSPPIQPITPSPLPFIENRPSGEYECGIPRLGNPLVVNGHTTEKGIWPWMIAMYIRRPENLKFRCSGTLISDQHVITAGQCMTDPQAGRRLTTNNILIKLGVFNIQDWADEDTKQTTVSKITMHPQYNKAKLTNDIVVLTLAKKVDFTDYIIPACLWDSDDDPNLINGLDGTVVGWGKDENGDSTLEPRVLKIPVVSTETCRANSRKHFQITSDTTLCAGGKDGSGPCNGDSGTGVYMPKGGRWYIRGVVSVALALADRTCDLKEYLVLTDVAKYVPWIQSVMG